MRHVIVLYGGKSPEHDVSRRSAKFIFKNLDRSKYQIKAVGITKEGYWAEQSLKEIDLRLETNEPLEIALSAEDKAIIEKNPLVSGFLKSAPKLLQKWVSEEKVWENDLPILYPIIHGGQNELGMLPGFFETAEIPYIGCDHLGSGLAMDKILSKQIAESMEIPIVPYVAISNYNWKRNQSHFLDEINKSLKYPLYVKPNAGGSSVGVYKVEDTASLASFIDKAFQYDYEVLVETGINCRELECAALGGNVVEVTVPGEVIANSNFYDYEAKYGTDSESICEIPAKIDKPTQEKLMEYTRILFSALRLHGLSRIDFLLDKDSGKIYFNEANTNPGFTSISQYPILWEHEGLKGTELLDRILEAAIKKYERSQNKLI